VADSKKFWNRIAKNYAQQDDSENNLNYKLTIEKTIKQLNQEDVLLDFACGPGTAAIDLADHVKKISAIDISDKMIEIAGVRAQAESVQNIEFYVSDIFDSRLNDKSFNVITAFNILHLIDDLDNSLMRIQDLLKAGGLFISLTDSGKEIGKFTPLVFILLSKIGIIPYFRQYSPEELKSRIESCGFSIIVSENLYESSTSRFIVAKKESH
jgi:ubiquinone/menaquinone biosynthesis C-methylase UbiE